jgi:hypothetical protein
MSLIKDDALLSVMATFNPTDTNKIMGTFEYETTVWTKHVKLYVMW